MHPQVLLILFVIRLRSITELPTSHLVVQKQVVWINLNSLQKQLKQAQFELFSFFFFQNKEL